MVDPRRLTIGLAALVIGAGGSVVWWRGEEASGGTLVRSAIVLAAIWFAYPALLRLSWKGAALALGLLVAALARPGLVVAAVPALLLLSRARR